MGDKMQQESKDLKGWVAYLGNIEIPILKQTARELQVLRDDDNASAQSISDIIARDPLMTALLLRYLQKHKHRSQTTEVLEVEQALLMLGIDPFYTHVVSKGYGRRNAGRKNTSIVGYFACCAPIASCFRLCL
jgi:HD-like signal output (HDOD) protein